MTRTASPPIEVHISPEEVAESLAADVRRGLSTQPKALPPKWLYDPVGCELFERICDLPEYYPTRTERVILQQRAEEVARLTGATTVVELGSGTSEKTRLLLDALQEEGSLQRFVGFDVAEPTLRCALGELASRYPDVEVEGMVGDFERHVGKIPAAGRRMVIFLGGTVGNLEPGQRRAFLGQLAGTLDPGEWLLLGTDLVKDPDRLVAAYDDAAGVTAEFNRNVLSVINNELGADFDLGAFDHVARWDDDREWIEMRLRSRRCQTVEVPGVGISASFEEGEEMRTEVSTKFRVEALDGELSRAGFARRATWTDPAGDFALTLSQRRP